MKASLFVFITTVSIFYIKASIAQTNYEDFKKVESILQDNFDTSSPNWELEEFQISNGWLKPTKKRALALIPVEVDQKRDFEMEVSLQFNILSFPEVIFGDFFVMFSPSYDNGLRNPPNNSFSIWHDPRPGFRYMPDPKYQIYQGKNFESSDLYLITIRKISSSVYFFINKQMVSQTPHKVFIDSKIGAFSIYTTSSIDFMNMNYIEKVEPYQSSTSNETVLITTPALTKITSVKPGGMYYGLIIGVSTYEDVRLNLDKPAKDASSLMEILVEHYSFKDSTTFLLLNPTRQKIIAELFRLRKVVGPNDNLLIFYAGHGYWDEEAKQGYWWASDAHADDPSFWLSNSDVREQIRSIKSRHTLLISDACFSGGIFKTRSGTTIKNASLDLQLLYRMPSRRAITSGTMTTVPDQSVFFEFMSKRLLENQSQHISSQQLFDSFRLAVINNSMVVPQDGVIAETGDEGGDFIFIRKN